jgi:hypothetical protein
MRAGNKAILRHQEDHRVLRVFRGVGGEVTYEGSFELATDPPWYYTSGVRSASSGTRRPGSPTPGLPVPTTGWAPETPLRAPRPISLGLTSSDETIAARYQFWGTHDGVKLLASQVALE